MSDIVMRLDIPEAIKAEGKKLQARIVKSQLRYMVLTFAYMNAEGLAAEMVASGGNTMACYYLRAIISAGDDAQARVTAAEALVGYLSQLGAENAAECYAAQAAVGTELIQRNSGLRRV